MFPKTLAMTPFFPTFALHKLLNSCMSKKQILLALLLILVAVAAITTSQSSGSDPADAPAPADDEAPAPVSDDAPQPVDNEAPQLNLLLQTTPSGVPAKLIERRAYTTSYNSATRTANWVAWTLTREHTYGSHQRTDERFEEDLDVAKPRATYQDYYDSRYDRGHLCPAGDNKWDPEAMKETFLMTNICPQDHDLNKEDWNTLEQQCRAWARRYGEVTIVCGPVFDADGQPRRIGRNKVRVPDAFFKVVYRSKPEPAALSVVMRNTASPQPWEEHVLTVDEVEAMTGIDFFPSLPDETEQKVESATSLTDWQ